MKKITILGSTGSIGQSTLDVVSRNRENFRIVALSAGRNLDLFEQQIKSFAPDVVAVADRNTADSLSKRINGVEILYGTEGISQVAAYEKSDFVVSAIVGFAGLMPTLSAVKAGKTIGLANKESLVVAGEIVMAEAARTGSKIIPVDSEHSAIFQCIEGRKKDSIRRIVLTASGGPFFGKSKSELMKVTVEDALRHPNWDMGRKISIDSATLMNKGLEVIEAHHLFGLSPDDIDVLIHPQSIVHSMVEFKDRSYMAQLSVPNMKGPIAYALSYPERLEDSIPSLDLSKIGKLTFHKPDTESFPCLSYAYEACREGGTMLAVLNAANEVAVDAFLRRAIGFNDIPVIIKSAIQLHKRKSISGIEDVISADTWARQISKEIVRDFRIKA
ncbi:MAG: 1-deoxy-D-xylulose-5-phosphate reductoisomerase [Nitrospirae bacterium]|nr:1-deoxy-D-xylulose-5-phosphate reductoisomerase [Nitrospirota bacterium]